MKKGLFMILIALVGCAWAGQQMLLATIGAKNRTAPAAPPASATLYPEPSYTEPTTNYPVSFATYSPPVEAVDPAASTPLVYEYTRQADAGDTIAITGQDL